MTSIIPPSFLIVTLPGSAPIPEYFFKALRQQWPGCAIEVIPVEFLPEYFPAQEIGGAF
jgi:hypothetical protein